VPPAPTPPARSSANSDEGSDLKYQLVLQWPGVSTADYDRLLSLEEAIRDGHDFGSGEMNIFIHTDNPKSECEKIKSLLVAGKNMRATSTYPLPQRGQVAFLVLTDTGVFTASASQEELSSHRHPPSKLGDAAQAIITQYQLIENDK
jgi:hypothetical protein